MNIRVYDHESLDYAEALTLRRRVLRDPLGLVYSAEDIANEADEIHIGAFIEGRIVGTLILVPMGGEVKMRQVAVSPESQSRGIGRQMVDFSEEWARTRGHTKIILHARETAVAFYERLGYECVGEPFTEVTIPHRAMQKSL